MSGYQGQPKRGYILPEPVIPSQTACVQFIMPDAPEYRRALVGALYELAKWYVWEKTVLGDTRAKQAAELWRDLLVSSLSISATCGEEIMFRLRQNETDTCLLEQSLDGGLTWSLAFDYSLCARQGQFVSRFDEDGNMEVSYDGGQTWIPATTEDPRLYAEPLPPLDIPPGDTLRCKAAANATGNMKVSIDQLIADSGAWGSVSGLVAVLLGVLVTVGIIGTGGALAPILLSIAAGLIGVGSTAFAAAFTTTVYDTLQCIFYCNMPETGVLSEADLAAIKTEIAFQIGGIAGDHLVNVLNMIGLIATNNLTRKSQTERNAVCTGCGDCAWCYDFDATSGLQNWRVGVPGHPLYGIWSGSGFSPTKINQQPADSDYNATVIYISWPTNTTILGCRVYLSAVPAGNVNCWTGPNVYGSTTRQVLTGQLQEWFFNHDWVENEFSVYLDKNPGSPLFIVPQIVRVKIWGMGANPFGVNNCTGEG